MIEKDSDDQPLNLSSLQTESIPPAGLEERIVSNLRERQLIQLRPEKMITPYRLIAVAACLVSFVAGMSYQKMRSTSAATVSMSESTFVLFLLEGSSYQDAQGQEQQQERISAYRNWAIDLRKQGIPVSGTKLQDEKNLLGEIVEETVQEEISGYFLIDAESREEALAIARKCPHLQFGGRIEVRRIHPV